MLTHGWAMVVDTLALLLVGFSPLVAAWLQRRRKRRWQARYVEDRRRIEAGRAKRMAAVLRDWREMDRAS